MVTVKEKTTVTQRVHGNHDVRSEEHTSELQSLRHLVCRLLLEKKKILQDTELTENLINGVERPVNAAEFFAITLRVRAGATDVRNAEAECVPRRLTHCGEITS